jgi:hypothetical protein
LVRFKFNEVSFGLSENDVVHIRADWPNS